jgi:hypothetical protein
MRSLGPADPRATWAVVWYLGNGGLRGYGVSYWATEVDALTYAATRTNEPQSGAFGAAVPVLPGDTSDVIATRVLREHNVFCAPRASARS